MGKNEARASGYRGIPTEVVLTYEMRLFDYAGRGKPGFESTIAVVWSPGAEACRWETTVDGRREPDLARGVPYAALAPPTAWTSGRQESAGW